MKMLNLFNRKSSSTYEAGVRSSVDKHLEKELKEFYAAASKGNLTKLRKLAAKKDIAQLNKLNSEALHVACARGHVDVVQFFIERKVKLNQCDSENRSALMKAVQSQHEQCVTMLLENHAEPNLADTKGNTALHLAANIPSVPIASLLLHHKANINAQNKKGFTPLIVAVREHYIKMANYLLNKKADVNVIDQDQRSPLMIAAGRGQIDMLELLMRFNANTALKDTKGWTACEYAVKNGFSRCLPLISKKKDNELDSSKNKQREIIQKGNGGKASALCNDKPELTNSSRSGSLHQMSENSKNDRRLSEGGKCKKTQKANPGKVIALRKREVSAAHCSDNPAPRGGPPSGNDQKNKLGRGVANAHNSKVIKQRAARKPLRALSNRDNVQKTERGLADVDRLPKNTEKTVASFGSPTSPAGLIHQAQQPSATKSFNMASVQAHLLLSPRHNGKKQEGQMKNLSQDQRGLDVLSKHDRYNDQKTNVGLGALDELSEWDSHSVTRHDGKADIKQMETEKKLDILIQQDRVNGQKIDLATKSTVGALMYDQKTQLGLSPEDELSDWDSPSVTSHDDTDGDNGQNTDVDLASYNLLQPVATKSSIEASAQSHLPLQLRHKANKQDGQSGTEVFYEMANSNNLTKQLNILKLAKITTLTGADNEVEFSLAPQADTNKSQQEERPDQDQHFRDRFTHVQPSTCEERVKLVEQRTKELTRKAAALEDQIHKLREEKNETESKFKQLADSLREMSIKEGLLEVSKHDCKDPEKETQLLKDIDGVKGVLEESPSVLGLHQTQGGNVLLHSGCEEKVQVVEERSDFQHQLQQLEEEKNETEANLRQLADSLEKLLTSETSLEANSHYHSDVKEKTQFYRHSGGVQQILEESEDHYELPEKRTNSLKSNPGETHKHTTIKQLREAVEKLQKKKASEAQEQIFKMGKEKIDTEAKLFQQADPIRTPSMGIASPMVNTHHHNNLEEKTTQLLKLIHRTKIMLENDNHCVESERQITCLEERDKNTTITELENRVERFKNKKDFQDQVNTKQCAFLEVNTDSHLQERTTQLLRLMNRTKRMLDNKNHHVQPESQIIMAKNTTIEQLKDIVERLKKERLGPSLTELENGEPKLPTLSKTGAAEFVIPMDSPAMDPSRHSQAEGGFRRMKEKVKDLADKKMEKAVSLCSQVGNVNREIKNPPTSPNRSHCCSAKLERSKMQPCEDTFPNHLRADNLVQVNLQFQTAHQKTEDQVKVTISKPHELEQNIQRLERELARACSMQYDSTQQS